MNRTSRRLGLLLLVTASGCLSFRATPSPDLEYASDYFSFVGRDDQGAVALAIDNNRGRQGTSFQAEHFVVLHDQGAGWLPVRGDGRYPNPGGALASIPDSPDFHFDGEPAEGMTIESPTNGLTLTILPLRQRLGRAFGGGELALSTAPAELLWQGRTIPGRVIHERLAIPGFNRMVRKVVGTWKDFQGLYLMVGDNEGDLYLHTDRSNEPGSTEGFLVQGADPRPFTDLTVEVTRRTAAWGFYRWPSAWRIRGRSPNGPFVLTLSAEQRNGISNWWVGGFSMAIVRGELEENGRKQTVYGLAELLR